MLDKLAQANPQISGSAPLDLLSVTVCAVDCQCPGLAMRALEHSVKQCRFADAILFSHTAVESDMGVQSVEIPRINSAAAYNSFVVRALAERIQTDYLLLVQWDGYVVNGSAWDPRFLDFDYIGARWPWAPGGRAVGNGGFSLRSRRLLHAASALAKSYTGAVAEDVFICDVLGPTLERDSGIRFAPAEVADRFSREWADVEGTPFGFHAIHNFPFFVQRSELRGIFESLPAHLLTNQQFFEMLDRYIELEDFEALQEIVEGAGPKLPRQLLAWRTNLVLRRCPAERAERIALAMGRGHEPLRHLEDGSAPRGIRDRQTRAPGVTRFFGGQSPSRRPLLAYVSPLPPERTGIAGYGAQLLPELSRWYDIEVVTDQCEVSDEWIRANCPIRSVDEFLARHAQYDRVLYHFGNSHFHAHMFGLLEARPGMVVLHDFFLSHAIASTGMAALASALYASHGYRALRGLAEQRGLRETLSRYPANLPVLERAIGVAVHSNHAVQLATDWYGEKARERMAVVNLARAPMAIVDRPSVRELLGFERHALVVCTFGVLSPSKLNHRLLEAWFDSGLANNRHAFLVFVGPEPDKRYGKALRRMVSGAERVRFTGWVDEITYQRYLAAADIAVQLRALSRGETSAAALDAMGYGTATIVNRHGSLGELEPDSVCMVPDKFSCAELAEALVRLARDPAERSRLGYRARAHVLQSHSPSRCAEQLAKAIEGAYLSASAALLIDSGGIAPPLPAASTPYIHRSFPSTPLVRRWWVDVSALVKEDLKTGIQRVIRAVLLQWLGSPPGGFHVEPVYADMAAGGYRHARRFACSLAGLPTSWAHDDPVDAAPGDIFVGLDLHFSATAKNRGRLSEWSARGVVVWNVVYDILPITLPDCFPDGTDESFKRWLGTVSTFDGLACISDAVAEEVRAWVDEHTAGRLPMPLIGSFPLGSDVVASRPTKGLPNDAGLLLDAMAARPTFLMVGTLEPRKRHAQTIAAFDALWNAGVDANLVIVGKKGWKVDELSASIQVHLENGERLWWLEKVSDEFLETLYGSSNCLIAASAGEGFGLPLIEAAHHGLPLLARNLPVFREVAGRHAAYFEGDSAEQLARAVKSWLKLFREDRHPRSSTMKRFTWRESARELASLILASMPGIELTNEQDSEPSVRTIAGAYGADSGDTRDERSRASG